MKTSRSRSGMQGFDDLTWKTAQTTGALALMPYGDAATYSGIYDEQDELFREQREIVVDEMRAASIIVTQGKGCLLYTSNGIVGCGAYEARREDLR